MKSTSKKLIRLPEVEKLIGLKRSTIYSLMSKGKMPQSVKAYPGARASVWKLSEIEEYINLVADGRGWDERAHKKRCNND